MAGSSEQQASQYTQADRIYIDRVAEAAAAQSLGEAARTVAR